MNKTVTQYLFTASCLLLSLLLLSACLRNGNTAGNTITSSDSVITAAKLLSMQRTADYTLVTVGDPWKGGVLHRYVLVPRDADLPKEGLSFAPLFSARWSILRSTRVCLTSWVPSMLCAVWWTASTLLTRRLSTGWQRVP